MKNNSLTNSVIFCVALMFAVIARFLPHPANFIPVGALIIFVSKRMGFQYGILLALSTMIISDFFIGYNFASPFVYLGLIGYVLAAKLVHDRSRTLILGALSGSVLFFIVSNFGVWIGPWYPHTIQGLTSCFILAIPFFKNTLASDIIFSLATFNLFWIYENNWKGVIQWPSRLRNQILIKR
jgi:hypothetical protein